MENKKKKKKWKILIPIGIVLFIVAAVIFGNREDKTSTNYVTVTEVVTEDIEAYVNASGVVLAKSSYDISSSLAGEVVLVNVKEGETVKKDQVLCELDTSAIRSQIAETEIQLRIAKESLVQILNLGSANYETSYKNALINRDSSLKAYEDSQKLYDAGVYSKSTLDNAYSTYIQSENTYNEMRSKYRGEDSSSDIKIQELRIESLENALIDQNEQLEEAFIKSPLDGVATFIGIKVLDYVSPGTPVFTVEDIENLKVEANISQYDIYKVSLGQPVSIKAEGIDDIEFEGEISHIGSRAVNKILGQSQEMVIEIDVDIVTKDTDLKPNYSAKIEIETASVKDVLVIPYEAVYITKEDEKIVYTVEDGFAKAHTIKRGVEGIFKFQLISDTIKNGDEVILNPTEVITDGAPVVITSGAKKETTESSGKGVK